MSIQELWLATCEECGAEYQSDIQGDVEEWDAEHEAGNHEFD